MNTQYHNETLVHDNRESGMLVSGHGDGGLLNVPSCSTRAGVQQLGVTMEAEAVEAVLASIEVVSVVGGDLVINDRFLSYGKNVRLKTGATAPRWYTATFPALLIAAGIVKVAA